MEEPQGDHSWAVFVDPERPRIVMIAGSDAVGFHWSGLVRDQERSTDRITVWAAGQGGIPLVVEATGGNDFRELEEEIVSILELGYYDPAGSRTLDIHWEESDAFGFPERMQGWIWWHGPRL